MPPITVVPSTKGGVEDSGRSICNDSSATLSIGKNASTDKLIEAADMRISSVESEDISTLSTLAECNDSRHQVKAMTLVNRCRLEVAKSVFANCHRPQGKINKLSESNVNATGKRRRSEEDDDRHVEEGKTKGTFSIGDTKDNGVGQNHELALFVRQDHFSVEYSHRNRVLIGSISQARDRGAA